LIPHAPAWRKPNAHASCDRWEEIAFLTPTIPVRPRTAGSGTEMTGNRAAAADMPDGTSQHASSKLLQLASTGKLTRGNDGNDVQQASI
jgi:hypothetical protein